MERARCVEPGFFPLDNEWELLPGSLTPSQHEHLVHLGSGMPFARAGQLMHRLLGVQVSEPTVRRLTERAGALVETVQEEARRQADGARPAEEGTSRADQKLVVSGDGAFVPLLGGQWAEVKMLAIGEVKPASARAQARGQEVEVEKLSSVARLASAEQFAESVTGELSRRGVPLTQQVAAVSDGAEWLQTLFELQCPQARRILDFPHAAQRLGSIATQAAHAGHPVPADWGGNQCHRLKTEGPELVLATLAKLPAVVLALQEVQEDHASLARRVELMQYPTFAHLGWPRGSGMVESANTLVMQARFKGCGMHGEPSPVNPMLA